MANANGAGPGTPVERPSALDVRELLDVTHDFLSRFLVMSDDGLRTLALWVLHTWAFAGQRTRSATRGGRGRR